MSEKQKQTPEMQSAGFSLAHFAVQLVVITHSNSKQGGNEKTKEQAPTIVFPATRHNDLCLKFPSSVQHTQSLQDGRLFQAAC